MIDVWFLNVDCYGTLGTRVLKQKKWLKRVRKLLMRKLFEKRRRGIVCHRKGQGLGEKGFTVVFMALFSMVFSPVFPSCFTWVVRDAHARKAGRVGVRRKARRDRDVYLRSREVLDHKYKQILKHRNTPRAAVHLMDIEPLCDNLTRGEMESFLKRVGSISGLHPLARYALAGLEVFVMNRKGDLDRAREIMAGSGHPVRMAVAGPFGRPGAGALEEVYEPEEVDGFREESRFASERGEVFWRLVPGMDGSGRIRPSMIVRPLMGGVVYLAGALNVKHDSDLALRIGTLGGYKVWIGRTLVAEKDVERSIASDQDAYLVRLPRGVHVVKIKLASDRGAWPLFLRVTAPDGRIAPHVQWESRPSELERASAMMGPPDSPMSKILHGEELMRRVGPGMLVTVEGYLRAELKRRPGDRELRKDLVRFLLARHPDDPRRETARIAALELVRLDDSPANYRFLARASQRPSDRLTALHAGLKKNPRDADTLLVMAREKFNMGRLDVAEKYLRRCLKSRPGFVQARLFRAELLSARGLHVSAGKELLEIRDEVGPRQDLARLLMEVYRNLGKRREAEKILKELAAEDVSNLGARRVLMQWALDRHDLEGALEQLNELRKPAPYDTSLIGEKAELLAANGRARDAIRLIRDTLKTTQDDVSLLDILGGCYITLGKSDEARKVWSRALVLRPQNAELRQRLALLEKTGPDPLVARYAVDGRKVVKSAPVEVSKDWDALVLLNRTAVKVLPNGMAHRFHHRIVKVLNERGAAGHGSWSVTYQPDVQSLRVVKARVWRADGVVEEATTERETNLSDPSVRIYYDHKKREIFFEKLRPGDAIELQITLNDTAEYSPFADYFGKLLALQESDPRRRTEVILEAPENLRFHFNKPAVKGLIHERKVMEGRQVLTWRADDVPAYVSEPSMPGWVEAAAYLHVSTFRSWADVAKWYWDLIREQYHHDEALREKTAELTRNLKTDEEKVRALYGFVARNIRYVALAFGIHTHKPYSAPQVLARRFGDCKDKAMLLTVMLGLAGVRAYPVLVRTRPGGRLGKYPASLAAFDHAVVYIPSLDRYLDGTDEFTGSDDLSFANQGGDALVIDGGKGRYTRIPILPASRNVMDKNMEIKLARDGSGVVTERIEISGQLASEWRYRFQEEARRRELFEKALSRSFPGAVIIDLRMSGIEDPEGPVDVRASYRVPHLATKRDGELTIALERTRASLVQRLAPLSRRRHPVELDYPFISSEKITINLPGGVTVREAPRAVAIGEEEGKEPGFRFVQKVSRKGRAVILERDLEIGAQRISVKEYPEFRRFCGRVDAALGDRLVFSLGDRKDGGV